MNSEDRQSHHEKTWFEKLTESFGGAPKNKNDLVKLILDARDSGIIDEEESEIIEGALEVNSLKVRDIMIPRTQMICVTTNQTPKDFLPLIIDSAHSRFPVLSENKEEVIGILLAKDLLTLCLTDIDSVFNIKDMLRTATFVPESKRLNTLLKDFQTNHNHMAIVVNEYGNMAGLITIEDVLEQIVGKIEDEHDIDDEYEDQDIRPLGKNIFMVKALTDIEHFNAYFKTRLSDEEFDTIGGIVIHRFGKLPKKGATLSIDNLKIKIVSADSRKVNLIEISIT